jgi:hypothetical protein
VQEQALPQATVGIEAPAQDASQRLSPQVKVVLLQTWLSLLQLSAQGPVAEQAMAESRQACWAPQVTLH